MNTNSVHFFRRRLSALHLTSWTTVFAHRSFRAMVFLLSLSTACAQQDLFIPKFGKNGISSSDWSSVYTHVPEAIHMKVGEVDGQSFKNAAVIEFVTGVAQSVAGKGTYFRSRPFVGSERFAVEWYEYVIEGVGGPQFELWGQVDTNPFKLSHQLLRLDRRNDDLNFGPSSLTHVKPGWRHFKIVVSVSKKTFDVYYEDMKKPVAPDVPLREAVATPNQLGLGFAWYLGPNTPSAKWQIGGVRVSSLE